MTFGSLFAGIGGMDLGLERAGLRCCWHVESAPSARDVLERHWPEIPRHDDATTFPPSDPEEWSVDLICGGDPCQGNSRAGAVHRRVHPDLGVHFLRIVGAIRPRLVLRENPTHVRADAPWPWHRFRSGLESLGYAVLPFRLRSCCVGLDHRRDRLFLLGALPDADRLGLEGIDRAGEPTRDVGRTVGDRGPGSDRGRHALPASRVCRGSDVIPGRVVRTIGLGNAVPPAVGEHIGRLLMAAAGTEVAR